MVFEEVNGLVAVEAEFFYKQTLTDNRAWYRQSTKDHPKAGRDTDPPHLSGAGNNAYIEILPDTRANHDEQLNDGVNYSNRGGAACVAHYLVYFNTPGRYYVWVRAYSCGTEDNGLHVGIDGSWPASGERMQWCEGKQSWWWESKQRTEDNHCGEPYRIYLDVPEPGGHEIAFSMREDGFEFDKFLLTTDREFKRPADAGPAVRVKHGRLPVPFPEVTYLEMIAAIAEGMKVMKAVDFPLEGTGFYRDQNRWLAINPNQRDKAWTQMPFPFEDGTYDVVFLGVGENDGKSRFRMWVKEKQIGEFLCPVSPEGMVEGSRYNALWRNVELKTGDAVAVESRIGSEDGREHSRGRWLGIVFAPAAKGERVLEAHPVPVGTAPKPQKAQVVGIRFQNVSIAKGTKIEKAYIQFTVDENNSMDPFRVTIFGQASDNSGIFTLNAYDVSTRPRTRASAVWRDIPPWTAEGESGPEQQTPDLAAIVQEIVDRDGWAAGNAMAFILEGTGTRTAISYEKSLSTKRIETAPQLVVVGPDKRIRFSPAQGSDDMEEVVADGFIDHGSTDLELCLETP